MSTFVLIHGAGDSAWYWHLVEPVLRANGHDVVAPDLPANDESAGLSEYTETVINAIGDRENLVIAGQSFGGFTATLVAGSVPADLLVLVAGMVPTPGESPNDWWANTGYRAAVEAQAVRDGGVTGNEDPYIAFFHDVPRALADEAMRRERNHPSEKAMVEPWPLAHLPSVPAKFVLGTEDRFFPPDFFRRVAAERLGVIPDEIASGHCIALSQPQQLADLLMSYAAEF